MRSESWPASHNQGSCLLTVGKWPWLWTSAFLWPHSLKKDLDFTSVKALSCSPFWTLLGFWLEIWGIMVSCGARRRGHIFRVFYQYIGRISPKSKAALQESACLGRSQGVGFRRCAVSAGCHRTIVIAIQGNPAFRDLSTQICGLALEGHGWVLISIYFGVYTLSCWCFQCYLKLFFDFLSYPSFFTNLQRFWT